MEKQGLDFFPYPTRNTQIIELLISYYGTAGHYVLIALLQETYAENGYFWTANKDMISLFGRKHCLKPELVSNVIDFLLAKGFFDKDLYKEYKILTNTEIQQNYERATARRKVQFFNVNYLTSFFKQNYKNVCNNSKNVCNNLKNVGMGETKEKKLKETKLKEIKERNKNTEEIDKNFITKFSSHFNNKSIDIKFVDSATNAILKEQANKIINCIEESEFLKTQPNITLKTVINNLQKLLTGAYKDFRKSNSTQQNFEQIKYSREFLNSLYTNIEDIEF